MARVEVASVAIAAAEREFGGTDILNNDAGTGSSETIMDAVALPRRKCSRMLSRCLT
jgi:hypothetical protein